MLDNLVVALIVGVALWRTARWVRAALRGGGDSCACPAAKSGCRRACAASGGAHAEEDVRIERAA